MEKLALLLVISLLPTHALAMTPRTAPHKIVCHTVEEIVTQVAEYEGLSDQKQAELTQLLKQCKQDSQLRYPRNIGGDCKGNNLWNAGGGYANGITLEALKLLKPYIKRGGTPFLEHCLASAIQYDRPDKVKVLVNDLQVNVNAIDSRDPLLNDVTPAPMINLALHSIQESSPSILECLLQRGANVETIPWSGNNLAPLGYMVDELLHDPEHKNMSFAKIALLLQYGANIHAINPHDTSLVQHIEQIYDTYQHLYQHMTDKARIKEMLRKERVLINEIYAQVTAITESMIEQQRPTVAGCFNGIQEVSNLVLQYARPDLAQEQQAYYEKKCDKEIKQHWPKVEELLVPFLPACELPNSDPGYRIKRENPLELVQWYAT